MDGVKGHVYINFKGQKVVHHPFLTKKESTDISVRRTREPRHGKNVKNRAVRSFVPHHLCCIPLVNHFRPNCFANAHTITPILIRMDFCAGKDRNPAMGAVNGGGDKRRLLASSFSITDRGMSHLHCVRKTTKCCRFLCRVGKIQLVQTLGRGFYMSILHPKLFHQMMEAKAGTHYALTINPDHVYVEL